MGFYIKKMVVMQDKPLKTVGKVGPCRVIQHSASHLDEARVALAENFYPHHLEALATDSGLNMSLKTVQLGGVTLGRLAYGAEVSLDFGELSNAYHISIPLSGRVEAVVGRQVSVSMPGLASVYLPVGPTKISRWSADCAQYGVKIDREYLEAELTTLVGHPVRTPVKFDPLVDLTRGPAESWLSLILTLAADLDREAGVLYDPLMSSSLAQAVTTGFLLASGHDHQESLQELRRPVRPRIVKRAVDAIHASPEKPFTVNDLAEVAGASVRSLQDGFQQHLGVPPMTYLRSVRLERVHEELSRNDADKLTVADVAHRWGFGHLGRFAAEYRRRYGETPSRTLNGG